MRIIFTLTDSDDFVVMLGDWLHQTTLSKFVQHHHSDGNNKGEGMLINGRGRFQVYQRKIKSVTLQELLLL